MAITRTALALAILAMISSLPAHARNKKCDDSNDPQKCYEQLSEGLSVTILTVIRNKCKNVSTSATHDAICVADEMNEMLGYAEKWQANKK